MKKKKETKNRMKLENILQNQMNPLEFGWKHLDRHFPQQSSNSSERKQNETNGIELCSQKKKKNDKMSCNHGSLSLAKISVHFNDENKELIHEFIQCTTLAHFTRRNRNNCAIIPFVDGENFSDWMSHCIALPFYTQRLK